MNARYLFTHVTPMQPASTLMDRFCVPVKLNLLQTFAKVMEKIV